MEFAAVAPWFFLIVFGIVEMGRGMMVLGLLEHAARSGCRQAILGSMTTDQVKTYVTAAMGNLGINTTNANVTVAVADNTSTALSSSTASGTEITVTASVPASDVTWFPAGPFLKQYLQGQYTARKE